VLETPVVLTGNGADPLFCLSPFMNWPSVHAIPVLQTAINFALYSWEMRAVPKLRLCSTILTLLSRSRQYVPDVPIWLEANFGYRCDVSNRVLTCGDTLQKDDLRPFARRSLRSLYWSTQFERNDAAYLGEVIESRQPYFDIRLVRYLLAIPELPYSMDKYLLRLALKNNLPETVRTRPKQPLRADPLIAAMKRHGIGVPQPLQLHPGLHQYVARPGVSLLNSGLSPERFWSDSKPTSLNNWLIQQDEEQTWKTKNILKRKPTNHPNCAYMATSQL